MNEKKCPITTTTTTTMMMKNKNIAALMVVKIVIWTAFTFEFQNILVLFDSVYACVCIFFFLLTKNIFTHIYIHHVQSYLESTILDDHHDFSIQACVCVCVRFLVKRRRHTNTSTNESNWMNEWKLSLSFGSGVKKKTL